jgi:hypothetical protein
MACPAPPDISMLSGSTRYFCPTPPDLPVRPHQIFLSGPTRYFCPSPTHISVRPHQIYLSGPNRYFCPHHQIFLCYLAPPDISVRPHHIFLYYLKNGKIFGENVLYVIYVFNFLHTLPKIFCIIRIISSEILEMSLFQCSLNLVVGVQEVSTCTGNICVYCKHYYCIYHHFIKFLPSLIFMFMSLVLPGISQI